MKFFNLNTGYMPRPNPIFAVMCGVKTLLVAAAVLFAITLLVTPIHFNGYDLNPRQVWEERDMAEVWAQLRLRLMVSLLIGGGAGLIAFRETWRATPKTEPFTQTDSGDPHVNYGDDARQNLRLRLLQEAGWKTPSGLYLAPYLALPRTAELKNILLIGAPNSGKSNITRALIDQSIERGDRTLILCNKGEITAAFSDQDSILIAAHHAGSFALDLAADVCDPASAIQFAQDIIPTSTPPFWSDCARLVLTDVILDVIDRQPGTWTARMLLTAALMDSRVIRRAISKIDLSAAPLIESSDPTEDDKTVTAILITMRSGAFKNLRPLAWAWDKMPESRRFSVRRWLAEEYKGPRTLIVQFSPEYKALSTLVAGRLIRSIATRLADPQIEVDPSRRVVLALDEFHLLDKIEGMVEALAVGREKGLVCWLGIQSYDQLVEKYGRNGANVLSDLFQMKIYGRLTPGEAADAIAKRLGRRAVSALVANRITTSQNPGKLVEERKSIATFSASRLASELGVFANKAQSGDVRAVVHCYGQAYVLEWPFTLWRARRSGFEAAAWLSKPPLK